MDSNVNIHSDDSLKLVPPGVVISVGHEYFLFRRCSVFMITFVTNSRDSNLYVIVTYK